MKFMLNDKEIPTPIKQFELPKFKVKYAVLRDKSPREVLRFSKNNPGVYIFIFITKLLTSKKELNHCIKRYKRLPCETDRFMMKPVYIGNMLDKEQAIRTIIEAPTLNSRHQYDLIEVPYEE